MNSSNRWFRQNLTRIATAPIVVVLFVQARESRISASERSTLASRFHFVRYTLPDNTAVPLAVPFLPMTSAGFILFSLYVIPDPATTPSKPARQVVFGLSGAAIYALLFVAHVVYGIFFALALTSATRGLSLHVYALLKRERAVAPEAIEPTRIPATAEVARFKQA